MYSGQDSKTFYRVTRPLLIAILALPLVPALTTTLLSLMATASGCALETWERCAPGGVDIGAAYELSRGVLDAVAAISASGWLLVYLILVGLLAQITTHGLRGRIVRTCAAIMAAGLMPFVLVVFSSAFAPLHRCAAMIDTLDPCEALGLLTGIEFYGKALFAWVAKIAVPLAVLVTIQVVLTVGYEALVSRVVRFCWPARE
ncbi:MAG: hypothetical protein OEM91_15205 [Hyphomicrobiales bacterium]|nr:hypothetical protein [Hyphomicrobiales bacterium]